MAFYNRKKSKADKEADRAFAQMSKSVNIKRYTSSVGKSAMISAKDAFLDLNPTIREVTDITGNGIKNVRAKYKERIDVQSKNNGLKKASKFSIKALALAMKDVHKEVLKGDSIDSEELEKQGISLDPSKFKLEAEEKKLFEDGDQMIMNTSNVIIKSDNKSVATLSSTILSSAMSIVRVNQEGFQSVLAGIGEVANTNVQFYNDMIAVADKLNQQMIGLNKLSKIETVGGVSANSAMEELVMGNFSVANIMQAYKDGKSSGGSSSASKIVSSGLGAAASFGLTNGLKGKGGKIQRSLKRALNMKDNAGLTIYDALDSNKMGNSNLAQRIQGLRDKKGIIGKVSRKVVPKQFAGKDGTLHKGSRMLKSLLFGSMTFDESGNPDTSNKLSKGMAVSFDAETHNTINVVIPGYLGKILAHFTKGPEEVYDYNSGKWTTVDKAREIYNNKVLGRVRSNDMVESFGSKIFGGSDKIPSQYNELMTELAKNRDLKPQDIKKMSDKYGEAAYTLYESIFKNEELMKDFKVARNSASREVFTMSKSKEFSGSMLNAFNDKLDFINDVQVEASQNRTREIKKINKTVAETNVLLGGKADGEGDGEKTTGDSKNIFEESHGLLGRLKNSKWLQGEGKTQTKIRGWLDKAQGKVSSLEGKLLGKGSKINDNDSTGSTSKSESAKSSTTSKASSVSDKVSPNKSTNGIIEGSGGSVLMNMAESFIGSSNKKGSSYKGITKMIDPKTGKIVDIKPSKKGESPDKLNDFTETLDKISDSKALSNSKLSKMFKKSPAARSVMDLINKMKDKGWVGKASDVGTKLSPALGEGWDLWAAGKQMSEGNILGGLMGYGMSKAGTKFGGKYFKNPLVKYGAEMAGSYVGTKIGHYTGKAVQGVFGGKANAEDSSGGPTANPMQGRSVLSGAEGNVSESSGLFGQNQQSDQGDPTLNSIAQVGEMAQQAQASGASLSSATNASQGSNPIVQSTKKETPLNEGQTNPALSGENATAVSDENSDSTSTAVTSNSLANVNKENSPMLNLMNKDTNGIISEENKLGVMDLFNPISMLKKTSGLFSDVNKATATSSNGFSEKLKNENGENDVSTDDPTKKAVDTESLSSPVNETLGTLFSLNDSMNDVIKKNPIIAEMQKNPSTMAKKLLAFTPLGAAFHMMDNGLDPISPSSAITSSIDNYFEDLADAIDEFIELAEKAAAGGGDGDGSSGGGEAGEATSVSASDVTSFLKTSINNNFGCDPEKMYKDVANFAKVKHYFGGSKEQIKKATERIKSNGVSPEWFWAYEGQEQGVGYGWLNHFGSMGDPWSNLDKTCNWIKETSRQTHQLAWYDAGFPTKYTTPKEKQEKGNKVYNSLPKGSIGRVYLTGTAAATWAAFDPEALKGKVNGVQDYGDPIKGCIQTLKKWGSGGSGKSKAEVSDEKPSADTGSAAPEEVKSTGGSKSTGESSKKGDSEGGDSEGSEKSEEAPPERSASLAKWDDDMQNKVIERVVKKYQLMYDELNGKKQKAAEATAKAAVSKIDDAKKDIKASTSDNGSTATSSDGKVAYVDEKGNIIINGGDPESLAIAKNKLKVENDILDILRKILKATKDISGYTKEALMKLVKMIKEIEMQTDLTEENNEVSEITNELLQRLNITGGTNAIGLASNPNEFELPNDMLIPVYRGY